LFLVIESDDSNCSWNNFSPDKGKGINIKGETPKFPKNSTPNNSDFIRKDRPDSIRNTNKTENFNMKNINKKSQLESHTHTQNRLSSNKYYLIKKLS